MAVDSPNRRFAMIGLGLPVPSVMPVPDGSLSVKNDRYQLLWLYRQDPDAVGVVICLSLRPRSLALSLKERDLDLSLHRRVIDFTLPDRGTCEH